MKPAIIYGNLWTVELEDRIRLVLSEAGECNWERETGDIPTEEELKTYLEQQGWKGINNISYILEHSTGDEKGDYRLRQTNPSFERRFPKLSKSGLLITPQCAELLANAKENEGVDLGASVFSVAYRDNRDRQTNPFHYTGAIARNLGEMYDFFREDDRFNSWIFGVRGTEISELLTPDCLNSKRISPGVYITPNTIKRYNTKR